MTYTHEELCLHALASIPGYGAATIGKLLAYFGSAADAWQATVPALKHAPLSTKKRTAFLEARQRLDLGAEAVTLTQANITLMPFGSAAYPHTLTTIPHPPRLLYCRGTLAPKKPCVAIVGARMCTPYGERVATHFAHELAHAGVSIVSGLALGIDAHAHRATLAADGHTLAVLGGGIDARTVTPAAHHNLANDVITNGGALLSEYPPGTPPTKGTFPQRNRIMAGLADAVIIIEAAHRSGTLITARYARDYSRHTFVVPGAVTNTTSHGSNALLAEHDVLPANTPTDVLNALALTAHTKAQAERAFGSPQEEILYNAVCAHDGIADVDRILRSTTLEAREVLPLLTTLELKNYIARSRDGCYHIV